MSAGLQGHAFGTLFYAFDSVMLFYALELAEVILFLCLQPDPGAPGAKKKVFQGPDAELAVQLERDMLDGSPGIRWGSVL